MECPICKNKKDNKIYNIQERMLNQGEKFEYLLCGKCGTLSLYSNIENYQKYYQDDYYAYSDTVSGGMIKHIIYRIFYLLVKQGLIPEQIVMDTSNQRMTSVRSLYGTKLSFSASILDVGGGSGEWIKKLYLAGFKDLTCCDLYAPDCNDPGICFVKGELTDLIKENKRYDLIAFHHSFEHMGNPRRVLDAASSLIRNGGGSDYSYTYYGKLCMEKIWRELVSDRCTKAHLFIYRNCF